MHGEMVFLDLGGDASSRLLNRGILPHLKRPLWQRWRLEQRAGLAW
jgi:hypothetical protein